MTTQNTPDRLQDSLLQVTHLLEKHRLVETMLHNQANPKQELIESLVHRQHLAELQATLRRLHPADVAYILEALPLDQRLLIWQQVQAQRGGEILVEVSDAVRESLLEGLSRNELLAVVQQIDTDDLPDVAEQVPADILQEVSQSLNVRERRWLQSSLAYPRDAVGHLMSKELLTIREHSSLENVLQELRKREELPDHTDKLFVVDTRHVLKGVLSLHTLLLADPQAQVAEIMAANVVSFTPEDKASDAALAFERYDLVSAPVVDTRGRLVGRLTVDVVMDFIRQEAEEEALQRAGLRGRRGSVRLGLGQRSQPLALAIDQYGDRLNRLAGHRSVRRHHRPHRGLGYPDAHRGRHWWKHRQPDHRPGYPWAGPGSD